MKGKGTFIAAIVLVILGLIFLAIGLGLRFSTWWVTNGSSTWAQVVAYGLIALGVIMIIIGIILFFV